MDEIGKKHCHTGVHCRPGQALLIPAESVGLKSDAGVCSTEGASLSKIDFGIDTHLPVRLDRGVSIPGYNAPALPLKPVRDPSWSLIALSGVEPSGPVMVEVPLVQNNSAFTRSQPLSGWRVGFADRYVQGGNVEPVEHRQSLLNALDILRQAGVQLVPVPALRIDESAQFSLKTRNEIDERATEYRLDALVSDSRSHAFHGACWSGYPVQGEPLEEGATLWFYGARWSGESLAVLVKCYRQHAGGATPSAE